MARYPRDTAAPGSIVIGADIAIYRVTPVGGGSAEDCIARLRELRVTVERQLIDVAGIAQFPIPYYRVGEADFEITASHLQEKSPYWYNACLNGEEVFVTIGWLQGNDDLATDINYIGGPTPGFYAYITSANLNFSGRSDPATEEITLKPSRPNLEFYQVW